MFHEPRRKIGSFAGEDGFGQVTLCVGFLTLIGGSITVQGRSITVRGGLVTVGGEVGFLGKHFLWALSKSGEMIRAESA